MKPERIQLKRVKGFNLQAVSQALNGLAAVNVARPSVWGNPVKVGPGCTAEQAVAVFRRAIEDDNATCLLPFEPRDIRKLRGKNLACFCKPGAACHADVLLKYANEDSK